MLRRYRTRPLRFRVRRHHTPLAPGHKAFRASRTRPYRPLAQTVSVSLVLDVRPCHHRLLIDTSRILRQGLTSSPCLPATDCAVLPASASLRPTSIRLTLPVREHRLSPLQRPTALTRWARWAQGREAVCPPTASVSSAVPGSLASPFHGAPEPAAPHAARHPPGPRSTSFRALGYWETLSRAAARTASRTGTTSHASPTRLRDSQQPRPTRKLTPHPQCVIHRHHPPDEGEKGINIYNGRQRLAPLRVLKSSAVRVLVALFNLLKINLLMSLFFTILYIVLKTYYYENTVT